MARLNTKFLLWSFLVIGVFWPIAYFIDRPLLFLILNTVAAALSVGVVVTFFPAFMRLARLKGKWSEPHWYLLGTFCVWTAIMGRFGWAWLAGYLGRPDWMTNNILLAFLTYLAIVAAVAKMLAGKIFDKDGEGSRRMGILAVVLMLLALVAIFATGGDLN